MRIPDELPTLAVLDWGVGGFGLVAALLATRPAASFVYVSDSGFAPYGLVPRRELAARISTIGRSLATRGVEHLVIACNAASTVADAVHVPTLRITDVVTHGIAIGLRSPGTEIAIVGGFRTIRAGIHRRAFVARGKRVVQRVAQPLSARIERGDLASRGLVADLARIVRPLRGVPSLLLACTHYPAIAERFAEQLPQTLLLDPVESVCAAVVRTGTAETGERVVLTTGDPVATRTAARRAFGVDPGRVTRVGIDAFEDGSSR